MKSLKQSLYRWLMSRRIKTQESEGRFTVQTMLGEQVISRVGIPDPFIYTRINISWYHLLVSLLLHGEMEITISINADKEVVDYVLEVDPDYIGTPKRRAEFDQAVQRALESF